jgi:hypothetical protein
MEWTSRDHIKPNIKADACTEAGVNVGFEDD